MKFTVSKNLRSGMCCKWHGKKLVRVLSGNTSYKKYAGLWVGPEEKRILTPDGRKHTILIPGGLQVYGNATINLNN